MLQDLFSDQTIPQILKDFLIYLHTIKGKSENTVNAYKTDLRLFLRFIEHYRFGNQNSIATIDVSGFSADQLKLINLTDMYAFINYTSAQRANTAPTRARKIASIKSFYLYLYSKAHLIDENYAKELETPKIAKKNPLYLNLDEGLHLIASIKGNYAARDRAMIIMFLNCGMRLSELVNIDLQDIKNDTLTVTGKGNKQRTIYLTPACITALQNYHQMRPTENVTDKEALFLSSKKRRISPRGVELIVKKHLKAAGLNDQLFSPHKLRHTAATMMFKHGNVDIRTLQMILGHESVSTTQIYTHVDDEQLRTAVNANPFSNLNTEDEKKDS